MGVYDGNESYKYTQDAGYDEVLELYTAGYVLSMANESYSTDTILDGAAEDLQSFLIRLEDSAEQVGWDRGYEEAVENEKDEVKRLRRRNEELEKLLDKSQRPTLAAISYFMGRLLITEPTPVDDVEKWAYQDGHNGAIEKIMDELNRLDAQSSTPSE